MTRFSFLLVVAVIFLSSCKPARHVPQGEYLLRSYELNIDDRNINREQLRAFVQQRPNKRILGARFHLWLFNSAKPEKTNWWNEGLRKNGEPPVIWQQAKTNRTMFEFELFLKSKGYYYSNISDTVIFRKRKANVIYNIRSGWPYTIDNISYVIPDTAIAQLVLADTTRALVKRGMVVDEDVLKAEIQRIEYYLRNRGYFSFSRDHIVPELDTFYHRRIANVYFQFKPHTEPTADNRVEEMPYPKYNIRSVTVNASLSMQNLLETANLQRSITDTLKQGAINFIMPPYFPVNASTINSAIFIYPGSIYRISDVNTTYQHLNGLRNFQQITSEFTEVPGQAGMSTRELDCMINLLPFPRQTTVFEAEGTNSEGNFGGGIRINLLNRSLLGNAEFFDLKLHGAVEAVSSTTDESSIQFKAKMEYEAQATINIPKFLLPFRFSQFTQRNNPRTSFSILYNYQQFPDYYVRTIFSAYLGYSWRDRINNHFVRPLDVYFVQLPYISEVFQIETLDRYPHLRNSYQPHMVMSANYAFVRDMRLLNRDNALYIRTNIESAGLFLNAAYRLAGQTKEPDRSLVFLGNDFSQFLKGDIDFRYYHKINENNRMVSRFFVGVGFPYGNSKKIIYNSENNTTKTVAVMPFEKKYHAGGANSMRGWRLRSLGPGSYEGATIPSYPNNTGDIKLEANLEYRFKLIWLLEGALFADAGNIWDLYNDDDRHGANFSFDRFYREISLSGGVGLRFDLAFFLLRADLGMKLRDPAGSGRWAFTPKNDGGSRVGREDFNFSVGIDYPFQF